MTNVGYGLIAGSVLGAVAVGPMFKMSFADKRAAISAAFVERFAIGFVIAVISLPWPTWLIGVVFGFLLSVPSALITKATVPILVTGTIGGGLIGLLLPYVVR